jgi:hypothetical protein
MQAFAIEASAAKADLEQLAFPGMELMNRASFGTDHYGF